MELLSAKNAPINIGNTLPLSEIPLGTTVHNVELRPKQGLLTFSQLNLSGEYANIRLSYSDDQYQTVVGTLKGSLDIKVGTDG